VIRFALPEKPLRVLCLGAHCDDIEIGCGGTLLRLIAERRIAHVDWVVFSSTRERAEEARRGADLFLRGVPSRSVTIQAFRDGYFPYEGGAVKDAVAAIGASTDTDLVFTHHRDDLHQDHRLIAELTWNTFRNHIVLEYEITKYDGNPFSPNFYVGLDEATCRRKIEDLFEAYPTQARKAWFTADTFMATLRLRGVESASATRYAEAFVCRKTCI
jgi:LmbE family N-acetylglucosaminyl deacetylase